LSGIYDTFDFEKLISLFFSITEKYNEIGIESITKTIKNTNVLSVSSPNKFINEIVNSDQYTVSPINISVCRMFITTKTFNIIIGSLFKLFSNQDSNIKRKSSANHDNDHDMFNFIKLLLKIRMQYQLKS
jgi:hypothetical protein